MNQLWVLVFLLFEIHGEAQTIADDTSPAPDAVTNFKPSLAVVIGILCVMFSLTFILLLYAKFCHSGSSFFTSHSHHHHHHHLDVDHDLAHVRSASRFSGIDKAAIESLPFFRFSSLKGSKHGLECAVCLSKFEDIEILRLLPKCKHAFHISCIDQWLEKHASCPLCRLRVNPEDLSIFTYSNSMRFMFSSSSELMMMRDDSNLELFVQREKEEQEEEEDEVSLIQQQDADEQKILHKYNHKITVSDVIFKNRWSSASSSDLMFLNSELLSDASRSKLWNPSCETGGQPEQVVKVKEEMEMKRFLGNKFSRAAAVSHSNRIPCSSSRSPAIDPTERRAMSEITGVSRFQDLGKMKNRSVGMGESFLDGNERRRRDWLPIARRTVQWFADTERRSQDTTMATHPPLEV